MTDRERDDTVRRAEELLQERLRARSANGHAATTDAPTAEPAEPATADQEGLLRDLQRLAADFANYRRRTEAERVDIGRYAKTDLIQKLLDVLDGYDRALETVPAELRGQPWVEGMWLVERKLRQLLELEGLRPLETLGRPFDPYEHEAVAHIASEQPENTVIAEHQRGYRLHERVIRPALVTVSKGPQRESSAAPRDLRSEEKE